MTSRLASRGLIAVGLALFLVGLLADLVGLGGTPGIGPRQAVLSAAGVSLAAVGVLISAELRRRVARWWADAPRAGAFRIVVIAVSLGLLTGAVETGQKVFMMLALHVAPKLPDTFFWLCPATYMVVFAVAGLALAVLGRLAPRLIHVPLVVFVCIMLGAWMQLDQYEALDSGAVWILALSIGWYGARWARSHAKRFVLVATTTLLWLTAALVIAAFVVPVERRSSSVVAAHGHRSSAPNVLLIVLDTVRADHLGCYGYERPTTPRIDALAAEGLSFDWAFSTSPWTLPAHASLFTGRYHHEVTADWTTPMDDRFETVAEYLSARGYATAGFVGNIGYCGRPNGIDRGFAHYEDFRLSLPTVAMCSHVGQLLLVASGAILIRNDGQTVTDSFLDWLGNVGDQPFFAFLNYFDAHAPLEPEAPYDTMFGPASPLLAEWYTHGPWTPAQVQGFIDAYDGCIRGIDEQVGRILDRLEAEQLLDETVIVLTSDHGELFGEHGLYDHANSLYLPLLHVPLIVRFPPRVPAGTRVHEVVSLSDVPATIVDLLGAGDGSPFRGHSLVGVSGESADPASRRSPALAEVSQTINRPPWWPASKGDMQSLASGHLHFILNADGSAELYDLRTDYGQTINLVDSEAGRERAEHMKSELLKLIGPKPGSKWAMGR